MKYKYGEFSENQIHEIKEKLRKSIFFLLIIQDDNTKEEYDVDVNDVFKNLLFRLGGLNSVLGEPVELVNVISYLETAKNEFNKSNFDFKVYRKLIFDAGTEIMKIKED